VERTRSSRRFENSVVLQENLAMDISAESVLARSTLCVYAKKTARFAADDALTVSCGETSFAVRLGAETMTTTAMATDAQLEWPRLSESEERAIRDRYRMTLLKGPTSSKGTKKTGRRRPRTHSAKVESADAALVPPLLGHSASPAQCVPIPANEAEDDGFHPIKQKQGMGVMFSPSFAPAFNDSHSMMSGLPSAGSALYPFAGDADSMYGMQTMVNTSPNSNSNSNRNVSASWNTDPFANPPPIQNVQSVQSVPTVPTVPTVQFESEFAMAPQSKDEEIQALRRQNGLLMQRVVDQQIQIETMSRHIERLQHTHTQTAYQPQTQTQTQGPAMYRLQPLKRRRLSPDTNAFFASQLPSLPPAA